MSPLTLNPIGVIHSPFRDAPGTPIQAVFAEDAKGTVEVLPDYAAGLSDLAGFDRIWLLYWFDRAGQPRVRVVPFRDTAEHGVFASRAPCRPNPIGLSCVRLLSVAGRVLTVAGVDILDGTPLLDIKPYVPEFDAHPQSRAGWLEQPGRPATQADGRFSM
jgi:tRNA-Thr(GGU) m(6)t(6)A37 methyltransferase TsaA